MPRYATSSQTKIVSNFLILKGARSLIHSTAMDNFDILSAKALVVHLLVTSFQTMESRLNNNNNNNSSS